MQCKLVETSRCSALIGTAGDCCVVTVVSECQVEVHYNTFKVNSYALKSQFIGLIFVAESHLVTRGQLRKPQHTYMYRDVRIKRTLS